MRIKSLSILALLLALTVGNANAQNVMEQPQTPRDGGWLTQNFEDNQMHDWTFQNNEGTTAGGKIVATTNHTPGGSRSYYLTNSNRDCYLISPELTNTANGVNVNFWYCNYTYVSQDISSLQIGYSMSSNSLNDFSWADPLDIVSDDWQNYVGDLPANVKYIAIAKPKGSAYLFVDDIVFSNAECPPPAVSVTTKTCESISLSWLGNSESYDLRYAPFYNYDFAGGLGDWMTSPATNSWYWNPDIDYSHSAAGSAISDVNVSQHDNYLVSPLIPFGGSMTFYVRGIEIEGSEGNMPRATPQYKFKVMYTTVENPTVNDFNEVGEIQTASESWQKYTIDLSGSGYSGTGHVAICHIYNATQRDQEPNQYKLAVDDITISYPWNNIDETIEATHYTIENLDPETWYAIQVKANDCDNWSATYEVQTLPATWSGTYEFVHAGDWNISSNWAYGLIPPDGADVTISAAARIPSGYVANVGVITKSANGSITINDGGQLKHSNTGVDAKMEKYITGYTGNNDHYQLLAFPADSSFRINDDNIHRLFNNDYTHYTQYHEGELRDLYYFDESQELEWINYFVTATQQIPDPAPGFSMIQKGKGYLYATNDNRQIIFNFKGNLSLRPSNVDVSVNLAYTVGAGFAGWNLVGNPFPCNAYLSGSRPFYRLVETDEGSRIVLAESNFIAPLEGVFVQASAPGETVTFTATEPNREGLMDFTLRKANTRKNVKLDRARVGFGEGQNMGHLDLMADGNRLYIPLNGKAMSVVHSQPVGEVPLNLEAAANGTFILSFSNKAENLIYCHLIDNMTGADVDLLQEPEYTFEARTTDYASRFRVVFASNEAGTLTDTETFVFNCNGTWIVANEGKATLQVIDMMGRLLSSETIDGSAAISVNQPAGIYMFRLINGNDVKVQKIVVR